MKKLFYPFMFLILISSCKKDDCTDDSLSTAIVGEWEVMANGIDFGDVEFHSDGAYTQDGEVLLLDTIGITPVEEFTYEVDSEMQFRIRADIGTDIIDNIVLVDDYNCDVMMIAIAGFDFRLERK